MDGSGVDYCGVFISCLVSHSDGTHSLQSIHCSDSDAMLHFSKSDEETNSSTSWMIWGWAHFQQMFFFGWTTPLTYCKGTAVSGCILTNHGCVTVRSLSVFLYQILASDWAQAEASFHLCEVLFKVHKVRTHMYGFYQ